MKTVAILFNERELERFQLNKPTLFIGRSPTCDVTTRAKNIRPVHFVVEWFGEGEFDPESGFWSVIEIAPTKKKESSSGEGMILGSEPIYFGSIQFKPTRDDLAESNLKKGVLKRSINENTAFEFSAEGQLPCLEVVSIRNSLESVESVNHFEYKPSAKIHGVFKKYPELSFSWKDNRTGVIQGQSSGLEIYNKNELMTSENANYEFSDRDVIIARSVEHDYFLRVVPKIHLAKPKKKYFDSTLLSLLTIFLVLFLLNSIAPKIPLIKEESKDTQRIAHVEIYQPETQVQEIQEPPPLPDPEDKKQEVIKQNETPSLNLSEKDKEIDKKGAPQATVKTMDKKPKEIVAGLNQKAPVKNVNQLGILGAIKAQKANGPKAQIRADQILAQRPASELDTAEGRAIVARGSSATLSAKSQLGGEGKDKTNLAQASTTLQNSFVKSQNGSGVITKSGGSALEKGLPTDSGKTLKMGADVGFEDGTTTEVQGGLDKDNVRQAIKENQVQIRACYERALSEAVSKEFSGKMTYYWKITADGDVVDAKLTYTDFKMPTFENCVKRIIDRIIFPKAKNRQATFVKYPFLFQGKK